MSCMDFALVCGVAAYPHLSTTHHYRTCPSPPSRHKSILDYLHSSGLTRSYEALLEETGCAFTPDPKARHAGLLEKKWTSVIRLQKKVSRLGARRKTRKRRHERELFVWGV